MKRDCMVVIVAVLMCAGCGSGLNDSLGNSVSVDGVSSSYSYSSDSLAGYQHLGILYDEEGGKELNDLAMQGEMYDRYRQEIQEVLNITMRYPIQEAQSAASGSGAWWKVPWYISVPDMVKRHYGETPGEWRYRINVRGMSSFFASEEGVVSLGSYISQQKSSSSELIEYGLIGTLEQFQPSIGEILGFDKIIIEQPAGIGIVSAFNGVCFMDPFSVTPTVMNLYQNGSLMPRSGSIMRRYQEVQDLLVDLQRAHGKVGRALDSRMGIQNTQSFGDIEDAENRLQSLYNQLHYVGEDREARRAVISRLLKESDDYEFIIIRAFNAMELKSKTLDQVADCQDVVIPVTLRIDQHRYYTVLPKDWWENVFLKEYHIKNPALITGYLLQDIALLKRLSLTRLSLAEEIFSGKELLQYRRLVASEDLYRANEIKNGFNIHSNVQDEIASICTLSSALIQPIIFNPNQQGQFGMDASQIDFQVIDNNETVANYGEYGQYTEYHSLVNWVKSSSYGECTDIDALLTELNSRVAEQTYTHAYKNYFVSALSLLADWEIRLRAHIIAADGL